MSNVAVNPQTGEVAVLNAEGAWEPARRATNPQTGAQLFYDGREWRPVPPPPEPTSSMSRGLGVGVRDMIVGLPAIPGMAYDAVGAGINAVTGALEAVGGPSLPRVRRASENLESIADAAGLPRPQNEGERYASAASRSLAGAGPTIAAGSVLQGAAAVPDLAVRAAPFVRDLVSRGAAALGPGFIPALGNMLSGNTLNQVNQGIGATTAGLAGQAAAEDGHGPLAQLAAGLVGGVAGGGAIPAVTGVGRGVMALFQPFSEAGRRGIASDVMLRSSANPSTLPARIGQGLDDPTRRLPDSPVTTALAARDPGLMLLESGMRSQATPGTPTGQSAAVAIRDLEAQRNATRLQALAGMADNSNPEARGAAVRGALDSGDTAMTQRVDLAFDTARRQNTARYSMEPVLDTARNALRQFEPDAGGTGIPPALQAIVANIERLGSLTIDQAQNVRRALGVVSGQAAAAQDSPTAAAAGAISAALENTINDPRWMHAVALRRSQGEAMGRDATGANATGQIVRRDNFGAPVMPDANVAGTAIATPQGARQTLGALYKALDDARTARRPLAEIEALYGQVAAARNAMRGEFIEDLTRAASTASDVTDAAGNVSRALSPAGFRRFFEANEGVARQIFEPGQLGLLRRIAADFAETGMAARTVSAQGSPTAQNLSVANLISRASNGLIDPGNPLAQTLGSVGGVMRLIYAAPEAATREMLTRAVTDPQFAQMLLARASPTNVQRAARYIETNMMERLTAAAAQAGGRAAIRTGTAEATRPEGPRQPR